MDVVIQKAENPSQQSTQIKKKRKVSAVSCTVYKPFEEQTASLNLPSTLSPLFEELDPKPGFLRIWPDKNEDIPLVRIYFDPPFFPEMLEKLNHFYFDIHVSASV